MNDPLESISLGSLPSIASLSSLDFVRQKLIRSVSPSPTPPANVVSLMSNTDIRQSLDALSDISDDAIFLDIDEKCVIMGTRNCHPIRTAMNQKWVEFKAELRNDPKFKASLNDPLMKKRLIIKTQILKFMVMNDARFLKYVADTGYIIKMDMNELIRKTASEFKRG